MKKYSKWVDVDTFTDLGGTLYLLQMKVNSRNGKKKFRKARISYIDSWIKVEKIGKKIAELSE